MKAITTKPLNAYHLALNSMTAFDFRGYPTFSHVETNVHKDKQGWDSYVYFTDGESVHVACKGYHITLNGERFNHGDINKACSLTANQPLRYT